MKQTSKDLINDSVWEVQQAAQDNTYDVEQAINDLNYDTEQFIDNIIYDTPYTSDQITDDMLDTQGIISDERRNDLLNDPSIPAPPLEPSPNIDGNDILMSRTLSNSLTKNPVLHYFNRMLLGYEISGFKEFCPDINGYVFIFMLPPHLSGYNLDVHIDSPLGRVSKMFPFFGIDFTPPQTVVTSSTIPSRSGGINYGAEVESTGQLQITYIDNDSLQCFGYHKTWINYIEDISRGVISPSQQYLDSKGGNFGEIDYATSAYVARFKPTSHIEWGDLVYIGKAAGIFPISLPDKEVIGRRDSNEITMIPMTYACTFYRQCTFGSPVEVHDWIIDELTSQCLDAYNI